MLVLLCATVLVFSLLLGGSDAAGSKQKIDLINPYCDDRRRKGSEKLTLAKLASRKFRLSAKHNYAIFETKIERKVPRVPHSLIQNETKR